MANLSVPFVNDRQRKELWCWAAVAANVYNSALELHDDAKKQQCEVVQAVHGGEPCKESADSNQLGTADEGLEALHMRADLPDGNVSLEFLVDQLTPVAPSLIGKPVCAQILWQNGSRHFVVVSGVDPATQTVFVEDPYHGGPENTLEYRFSEFVHHYRAQSNGTGTGTVRTFQKVNRRPLP